MKNIIKGCISNDIKNSYLKLRFAKSFKLKNDNARFKENKKI